MRGDPPVFRSDSFALVLVLMALVLLSGVVVAFLGMATTARSLSSSSASSARVELLARTSLDTIVADLLDEIAAGSTVSASSSNVFYLPASAATVVPQRVGDLGVANMVKSSQPGLPSWYPVAGGTNGPIRALANNGSDRPSANGLRVVTSRWLVPGLIGTALPSGFIPPSWVLLTPSGAVDAREAALSRDDLTNAAGARFPVGRFAYAVYDVGGLVDINRAGGLLGQQGNAARFRAGQIPLSSIPGILDPDSLVSWRDGGATNLDDLLNPTNTFAALQPGQQAFVDRQDLLRFQKKNAGWMSASALPYLTVFSRAVNRPLFTVPASVNALAPVTPLVSYSDATTFQNPAEFLAVRRADGTLAMPNRFPLSRLKYFDTILASPTDPVAAAAIQRYFGLTRAGDGYAWLYRNSKSSAIKTLAQVAGEKPAREPDFFEVLKAAILSGSLGQGGQIGRPGTGANAGDSLVETRDRDNDLDRHIFQIGVNLIDQSDADDYPTLIQRTVSSHVPNTAGPLVADVAGTENLPYLSEIAWHNYRLTDQNNTYAPDRQELGTWFRFEFWNPHQNAPQAGTAASTPSLFRVVMTEGKISMQYARDFQNASYGTSATDHATTITTPPIDYGKAYATDPDKTPYQIQFVNSADFADPQYLMAGKYNVSSPGEGNIYPTEGPLGVVGIVAGRELCPCDPFPPDYRGVNPKDGQNEIIVIGNYDFAIAMGDDNNRYPTWEIQFRGPDGKWHTYQRFANFWGTKLVFTGLSGVASSTTPAATNDTLYTSWDDNGIYLHHPFVRLDPRGERFGLGLSSDNSVNEPLLPPAQGVYYDEVSVGHPDNANLFFQNALSSTSANVDLYPLAENVPQKTPSATSPYMADRDGVIRHGDPDNSNAANKVDPLSITDAARQRKRPVLLNRPFQSVGEMGYAFRDLPWKTVDFSSADSGDAALLDFFTCEDPYGNAAAAASGMAVTNTAVLRGKVSLNTRQPAVLRALVDGAAAIVNTNTISGVSSPSDRYLSAGTATVSNLTEALVARTKTVASSSGVTGTPLKTRGDLVAALAACNVSGVSLIKGEKEAMVRALADLGDTQTWNLMVDVIVQSGGYLPQAANADAGNFQVSAERRYWLHVAIDRYSGRVIDSHLEIVDE